MSHLSPFTSRGRFPLFRVPRVRDCSGGGIGRHTRLRGVCRKACRFDSCPEHHASLSAAKAKHALRSLGEVGLLLGQTIKATHGTAILRRRVAEAKERCVCGGRSRPRLARPFFVVVKRGAGSLPRCATCDGGNRAPTGFVVFSKPATLIFADSYIRHKSRFHRRGLWLRLLT